jgi:hypothetical protein
MSIVEFRNDKSCIRQFAALTTDHLDLGGSLLHGENYSRTL